MDAYLDEGMGDVTVGKPFCREVSTRDKLNGTSHLYQKLKSFYKGALNLGPEYIKDAKIEELLTRGHEPSGTLKEFGDAYFLEFYVCCSHAGIQTGFRTYNLAHIRNMEDHIEQISGEVSVLIL
ncbi:hypothetical protein Tco_1281842 [Tanacetum coccineum]